MLCQVMCLTTQFSSRSVSLPSVSPPSLFGEVYFLYPSICLFKIKILVYHMTTYLQIWFSVISMFLSIILVKVLDGHGFDLHFFIRCKFSCLNHFSISTDTKIMRSYVSQCSILILNRLAIINFSSTNGLKFFKQVLFDLPFQDEDFDVSEASLSQKIRLGHKINWIWLKLDLSPCRDIREVQKQEFQSLRSFLYSFILFIKSLKSFQL